MAAASRESRKLVVGATGVADELTQHVYLSGTFLMAGDPDRARTELRRARRILGKLDEKLSAAIHGL